MKFRLILTRRNPMRLRLALELRGTTMKKSFVTRTSGMKETFLGLENMMLLRNSEMKLLNIRFIAGLRSEALSLLKSLDPGITRCLRPIRLGNLCFLILKMPQILFGVNQKKKDSITLVRVF